MYAAAQESHQRFLSLFYLATHPSNRQTLQLHMLIPVQLLSLLVAGV